MKWSLTTSTRSGLMVFLSELWKLIKVAVFSIGAMFILLHLAADFGIGNCYFYYGPQEITVIKEFHAP